MPDSKPASFALFFAPRPVPYTREELEAYLCEKKNWVCHARSFSGEPGALVCISIPPTGFVVPNAHDLILVEVLKEAGIQARILENSRKRCRSISILYADLDKFISKIRRYKGEPKVQAFNQVETHDSKEAYSGCFIS